MTMIEELQRECLDRYQVLRVLETELQRMAEGEPSDLEAMREALFFLTQYPNVIDKAKDTAIQQRLVRRDAASQPLVETIRAERTRLERQAQALLETIEDMLEDVVVPLDEFLAQGLDYVRRHYALVQREKRELLPRVSEKFGRRDLGTADDMLRRCKRNKLRTVSRERYQQLVGSPPATAL